MVTGASLRRVRAEDYAPRTSLYLEEGYKSDDFELTNVMIGEKVAIGSVTVNRFFPPMDGEFYLSTPMAMIWVFQLGIIYSMYDVGAPKKDRKVYLRQFSMKCRKRVVELNEILVELLVTSRVARDGRIHYRAILDVDVGSFIGEASWFMSDRALIESA